MTIYLKEPNRDGWSPWTNPNPETLNSRELYWINFTCWYQFAKVKDLGIKLLFSVRVEIVRLSLFLLLLWNARYVLYISYYVNRPTWRTGMWRINTFGHGVIHHTRAILISTQCNDVSVARTQPGLFTLNRDISVSRTLPSGHWDWLLQTGTVPEKPGPLVTLLSMCWTLVISDFRICKELHSIVLKTVTTRLTVLCCN